MRMGALGIQVFIEGAAELRQLFECTHGAGISERGTG